MAIVDECILGNSVLHERFCTVTEILAKLVSSAPRAVSIVQLEELTGRASKDIVKLCSALERTRLVRPAEGAANRWILARDPSAVTLEDVFRCVLAEQQGRSRLPRAGVGTPERACSDVDLLVMQAMIAINQSVFKHLRQFSLDRLKISAAGVFPARRHGSDYFDEGGLNSPPGLIV
jgi:DNA-binding IscR family transcriptional regulator